MSEVARQPPVPYLLKRGPVADLKIAVIAGDGIGPEVTREALRVMRKVLDDAKVSFEEVPFSLGAERYLDSGHVLDEDDLEALADNDAILLGAVGDPRIQSGILERGLLLRIRFAFDQYVNLRPSKHYPGVASPLKNPEGIDFVVVREGTEGPYAGAGGVLRVGTDEEVATEVSVNTAYAIRRVVRYAYNLAQTRPRKHLTLLHKNNVLGYAGSLWTRIFNDVGVSYPEVTTEYLHIDAATVHLLTRPQSFDVIVTDNLFGDIITDEAGAITGGIGLAASANINPDGNFPSMFEPIHGSAPDIAGKGLADPIAAIGSAQLLLESLGFQEPAKRIEDAIDLEMKQRAADPDNTGARTTTEIGDAVLKNLDQK